MVVDASAIAAWYLPTQATKASEALLRTLEEYDCVAPVVFEIEVRSLMLMAERRRHQSPNDTNAKLSRVFDLVAVRDERFRDLAGRCLSLARRSGLKLYDAAYLDLALGEGLPLASRDRQLLEAAGAFGVSVFDLRPEITP